MTAHSDTFLVAPLPQPPWIKVVAGASDLQILDGHVSATSGGDGNYIFFAARQTAITGISASAGTVTVTTANPHNYPTGTAFTVRLSGTAVLDGTFSVVSASANSFEFTSAVTTGWTLGAAHLNYSTGIDTANTIQVANVMSSAVGDTSYVVLWARLDAGGGPAVALRRGFGLRLWWKSATERALQIVRISPTTGLAGLQVVAEAPTSQISLFPDEDGSDLLTLQQLTLVVTDNDVGPAGEASSVLVRGYLNALDASGNTDLSRPTVEYVDRGSGDAPVPRGPGTWAITFGQALTVFLDSWKARDGFEWPTSGSARVSGYRTLAELREMVITIVARGPATNIAVAEIDEAIRDGVRESLDLFSGLAPWLKRWERVTVSWVDSMCVLPGYIDEVLDVFEASTRRRVNWSRVHRSPGNQTTIVGDTRSTDLFIAYLAAPPSLDDDDSPCPIPKEHDELVRYAAALRLMESRKATEYLPIYRARYDATVVRLRRRFHVANEQDTGGAAIGTWRWPSLSNAGNLSAW